MRAIQPSRALQAGAKMMARWILVVIPICGLAATTHAGELVHELVPVDNTAVVPGDDSQVPDFNDGSYFTYDLVVLVPVDDDWQITTAEATISGPATFFQHPSAGDVAPDGSLIAQYPAVEFDSYFSGAPGTFPGFADGPYNQPTSITADWFDVVLADVDQYPIARFSVQWTGTEAATLTVDGQSAAASTQFPWVFRLTATIPEPGAFLLLSLGALGVARRRR
jgi:hypothetical protein